MLYTSVWRVLSNLYRMQLRSTMKTLLSRNRKSISVFGYYFQQRWGVGITYIA